nr:hypothetical protein [Ignavibacteria bacterium]
MKISLRIALIILLTLLMQSGSLAGKIELKFFSSETGYALFPENLLLSNINSPSASIKLNKSTSNIFYSELAPGTYCISTFHTGYAGSQTYFTIGNIDISYDIFLDPLSPNVKLNPVRIKSLLRND